MGEGSRMSCLPMARALLAVVLAEPWGRGRADAAGEGPEKTPSPPADTVVPEAGKGDLHGHPHVSTGGPMATRSSTQRADDAGVPTWLRRPH